MHRRPLVTDGDACAPNGARNSPTVPETAQNDHLVRMIGDLFGLGDRVTKWGQETKHPRNPSRSSAWLCSKGLGPVRTLGGVRSLPGDVPDDLAWIPRSFLPSYFQGLPPPGGLQVENPFQDDGGWD